MKDTKSILLLVVSFLLVAVSCVLLWTWGYRVYKAGNEQPQSKSIEHPVTPPIPASTVVSLPEKHIDSIWNNADSLRSQLDVKLNEFNRLRNEINALLKNPSGEADLGSARQKIMSLQQIVEELRHRNKDIENENQRLQSALQQLSAYLKSPQIQNVKRVAMEEKGTTESSPSMPDFTATDLRLSAIMFNNEKEEETVQAGQAEKLVGSLTVRNNSSKAVNTEMQVVVIQPDGQVLKGSAWESGIFSTPEGKKVYSYKLKVDLTAGESRKVLFSLISDKYLPGNYTMQLYCNGLLIGKYLKSFS